jgi:hypothetical protein
MINGHETEQCSCDLDMQLDIDISDSSRWATCLVTVQVAESTNDKLYEYSQNCSWIWFESLLCDPLMKK